MKYNNNSVVVQLPDKPNSDEFEMVVNPYDSIDNANRKGVILRGEWKNEYLIKMQQENITALYLNISKKWRPEDYSFLEKLIFIKELNIIDTDMKNLNCIESMSSLEELSIEGTTEDTIDFTKLKNLKKCYLSWKKGYNSIFNSTSVESLSLYFESSKPKSYDQIGQLVQLKKLSLNGAAIKDISFLKNFKKLCWLEFVSCKTLADFSLISVLNNLRRLTIIDLPKLTNLDFIEKLQNLKLLELEVKIIDSLSPLEKIHSLEYLYLYRPTNVLDGDLSPILKIKSLKDIEFQNKKHYNYKFNDIFKQIQTFGNLKSAEVPIYETIYLDTKKWCNL